MINKYLLVFFLNFFNLCFGQFFYTGYQQAENWLATNSARNYSKLDSTSLWQKYKDKNKIIGDNDHHFGVFLNLRNSKNSRILQHKSDLIGNGILTNYTFSIPNFEVVNSMFFTNTMQEADRGFVRTIKDVTMYTNQAYLKYSNNKSHLDYSFKVGRDFIIEGKGIGSKLFFSDFSRPFDQLSIKASYKNINGKFSAISLDSLYNHNRFLYMHSLGLKIKNISISFGEAIISTGINETINIKYLNPFNFWAWENIGSLNNGLNALLYFGIDIYSKKKIRLYSELLIDDINFHNKNAFYLNKYALLIGIHKTSFPFNSSNIWIEHTNVLNQVYQTYHPTHIYTHRGYPIGHYLGNDFINTRLHYSQLFEFLSSKLFLDLSYTIQGKNNINTPFENPWEDNLGNKIIDYSHPGFPTPPLQKIIDFNLGFEVSLKNLANLSFVIENQQISQNIFDTRLRLSFWSYLNIVK